MNSQIMFNQGGVIAKVHITLHLINFVQCQYYRRISSQALNRLRNVSVASCRRRRDIQKPQDQISIFECLFGNSNRARWLLRRFYHVTTPDARIIAESNDPHQTSLACHLAYQRLNRLHADAKVHLDRAEEAMQEKTWDKFMKHTRAALGIESRAY